MKRKHGVRIKAQELNVFKAIKSRRNSSQETVETYFKPKTNVIYARFLFNSAPQNTEEGIDEFVNRLRKMASRTR